MCEGMSEACYESLAEEFESQGAVCLRKVFNVQWLNAIREGINKNMERPSCYAEWLGENGSHFFDDYCNWRRISEFQLYVLNSPAAEIVARIMKSKYVSFYHDHVLVKEAGSLKETPWHQDQPYYPVDGNKVCSLWMPVDSVPRETCLRFVSGSHHWGWYYPRKFATSLPYEIKASNELENRKYEPVPDIVEDNSNYNILTWNLEPGDCIIFHMRTLHGAPGNLSLTRSRRVLSTRWLGDDAVIARRPWDVSPPTLGGLKPGDRAVSEEFPIIWQNKDL